VALKTHAFTLTKEISDDQVQRAKHEL